jgi:hypothetical protein
MATTASELERIVGELSEANLDFEAFAQKHVERVNALIGCLAEALDQRGAIRLEHGYIGADWRLDENEREQLAL